MSLNLAVSFDDLDTADIILVATCIMRIKTKWGPCHYGG